MDEDLSQIFLSEFISVSGGLLAGLILASSMENIESVVGLLVILPGFMGMRGNIGGTLSARLGSALHLGTLKPKLKFSRILSDNIIASLLTSGVLGLFLGFVAFLFTLIAFGINDFRIVPIAFFASIISAFISVPIAVVTEFFLFRRGFDPDNIMGPYITTLGDVVSTLSLLAVMGFFV